MLDISYLALLLAGLAMCVGLVNWLVHSEPTASVRRTKEQQ